MSDRIVIDLPDEAPVPQETLSATRLPDGTFEVRSAPFVTYEVCRGDVVRCADGDPPRVQAVVRRGGHATVRMLLEPALDGLDRMRLLLGLKELGLVAEDPRGRYHALDAGPQVDLEAVVALLDPHAEAGSLAFEVVEPED